MENFFKKLINIEADEPEEINETEYASIETGERDSKSEYFQTEDDTSDYSEGFSREKATSYWAELKVT